MRKLVPIGAVALALIFVFLFQEFVHWEEEDNAEIQEIKEKFLPRMLKRGKFRLLKENFSQLSPYQKYVTPQDQAVLEITNGLQTRRDAYRLAVSWVWVSDLTLHGVEERWIMPHNFLADTPNYPTNPVPGRQASDCESQAYTLVSILRAMDVSAEDVRVAIGKVNFGGEVGGHAWAEVREDGSWLQLESTSGPYWDDEEGRLYESRGYPYWYFSTHEYPSIEVWGYFNDIYYYNPSTGEGNAPAFWRPLQGI